MYSTVKEMIKNTKQEKRIRINKSTVIGAKTFIQQCETEGSAPIPTDFIKAYFPEDEALGLAIFQHEEWQKRINKLLDAYIVLLKEYNKYLKQVNNILKKKINIFYKYGTREAAEQIVDSFRYDDNESKIKMNEEFILSAENRKEI